MHKSRPLSQTRVRSFAPIALVALMAACGGGDDGAESGAVHSATQMHALSASPAAPRLDITASNTTVTADMVLSWAQFKFPQLFPADAAVAMPSVEFGGVTYNARAYGGPWGWRYLGITPDGRVFGMGDFTNNSLQQFETIAFWAPQVTEIQARLEVPDGAVVFDQLRINGYGGVPGTNNSNITVSVRLDGQVIFTAAGGVVDLTYDLAAVSAGVHTLVLEVISAGTPRASISRTITVQQVSPQFRDVKSYDVTVWSGSGLQVSSAFDGRIVLHRTCPGGRVCRYLTTADPSSPLDPLDQSRFGRLEMNYDWTWLESSDGFGRFSGLIAAPGNPIPRTYGTCKTPGASAMCLRRPTSIAVKEWVVVGETESTGMSTSADVLRNLLTGEERAVPGVPVVSIPPVPTSPGGWRWIVRTKNGYPSTNNGYAVYDSSTLALEPLGVQSDASDLTSDGRRLIWLGPSGNGTAMGRRLYAALPDAVATPVLLADGNMINGPHARDGWVVWTERDTVQNQTLLKANNGIGTLVLASAAELALLAHDGGAVAWWDGRRTRLWSPSSGYQVVATNFVRSAITQRKLYATFPDRTFQELSF